MRAILATEPGGPEVLTVSDRPDPTPAPGEMVVTIAAAGLNRADLLQRQGFYPPPPGASDVIGMECSGTVAALGEGVSGWSVGDEVCALLAGGGYAEQVAVPAGQVMRLPAGVPLIEAAALPEVACTVWSNLVMTARIQPGETLLVHGGAGGIGSFALQLAQALGVTVLTSAGTEDKRAFCRSLGADVAIDYHHEDFVQVAKEHGGADVILDNMGAKYLARNVDALADGGRLVVIGLQGGAKAELDINALMRKRASVAGTTLRSRPSDGPRGKAAICAEVVEHVWPLVEDGTIRPIIDATFPLEQAAAAHERMTSGEHTGKLLLTV
ncbi:putative NAD(P)H quinone oxidoreductase, PIG3 family [Nocardioides terrae]|uniref:Putative NAD(P)H quinone oxidoreductase, PIG3 family n=1 Tax=Nocardioides terrae TaxID=574651 RepID=A0A1I1F360_9ACTN|nr:NAD(P)H-quinone oxidoreductase [Nocardioides terrae]SFB93879.1 putative NAD(P)H quinone oxidoreductase, PIG3 family [Nocardioides terrae]